MAKTNPTTYKLEHKATGRSWETESATEAVNLKARGWTVKSEPVQPEAKAQQPDATKAGK